VATHIEARGTTTRARGAGTEDVRPYPGYKALWMWLLLGWVASGADRTITGPVVTYMIQAKVPMISAAEHPFALGGLVGSLLFAGYMVTQFPGGYIGDRFGHRTVIVIAVVWAGLATILSGVVTALLGFVAFRVLTGLGAGLFYSNDRTVVAKQSPLEKRSLGMGWVITGLAIGITLALLLAAPLLDLGTSVFGKQDAWRMPFLVLGSMAVLFGLGMNVFFRGQKGEHEFHPAYLKAAGRLAPIAAVLFVAIMAIYLIADKAGLSEWLVAVLETAVALLLVGFVFVRLGGGRVAPVLKNRDLMLVYCAGIAILWTLWFFSFWSVSIVGQATHGGFWESALTATFFGVAGIIGFPLGGWLGDVQKRRGRGRKGMLVSFTLIQALLTIAFGFYLQAGGNEVWALGTLLFVSSLFFNALQPIWHALAADLVPTAALLGAAFGMMNLIGEMGAVLSPAISGVLRDATGNWQAAVFLDGGLMLVSFVLLALVRERKTTAAGPPRFARDAG
jgi:MFS family permease